MAMFGRVECYTMQAGADLRARQYHVLRQSAAGQCNISSRANGAQTDVIGVLQNKPNNGDPATVGFWGETKVVAGGAVTAGLPVAPNGSGRVVNAASGDWSVGIAQETAATDGEVVRVLLRQPSVRITY